MMQRVVFSVTPKGPRLLFEASENIATAWSLTSDRLRLHDVSGAAFAESPMELLASKYMPTLESVCVTAIAPNGDQTPKILDRHYP